MPQQPPIDGVARGCANFLAEDEDILLAIVSEPCVLGSLRGPAIWGNC